MTSVKAFAAPAADSLQPLERHSVPSLPSPDAETELSSSAQSPIAEHDDEEEEDALLRRRISLEAPDSRAANPIAGSERSLFDFNKKECKPQ